MIKTLRKIFASVIACLLFIFIQSCQPDLVVEITSPPTVRPGEAPGTVTVEVKNVGNRAALGTQSAESDGYMVDIVLSSDDQLPVQFAVYSETFSEDVLLRGGRISNTSDLAPGESKTYTLPAPSLLIPEDTPPGEYCLGAVVDPGKKIAESNEDNNTACATILISGEEGGTTTVFIVRHAERSNDALTEDGEKRAETLARMLETSGVSVVFSTNTTRTRETVNNYADPRGIAIQMYGPSVDLTNLIRSEYVGSHILVAGHSNTVTEIVGGLGVADPPQIGNEYNNLFVVTICPDGMASLIHLNYEIQRDL
jgi:hypothetical protein